MESPIQIYISRFLEHVIQVCKQCKILVDLNVINYRGQTTERDTRFHYIPIEAILPSKWPQILQIYLFNAKVEYYLLLMLFRIVK